MKQLLILLFTLTQTTLAQYPNVRVSSPNSTDPNETSIAINPANPSNLVAGANISYYYYSTNAGQTWVQNNLTSSFTVWGDPCVVFDANGHAYFGHLTNPAGPAFIDRIVVQKSTTGGSAWNDGVGIGLNLPKQQDKEWIAADMTNSPYRHNLYMAWTEFDSYGSADPNDSSRILFSRSTNGGASWSSPIKINELSGDCLDEDNTTEGAVPAVGPNGEVYLAWAGPAGIVLDRSFDGGVTFGSDLFVTAQPGGWDFGVSGVYRSNGLPITACDVSNSPYRGHVYVLWADQRNGLNNTDVFLIKSTDGGDTWGSTVRVNTDNSNRDQFFPWMTIDPVTGYLYVVFYDRRNTTGTATEVWLAKSTDGGSTFSNFKISASTFTPNQQVFFGDYNGIAAMNGKVYPLWMRMDNSSRSIWTALVNDVPTVVGALRDTILPVDFGEKFIAYLPDVFADNDNPALEFTAAGLSPGVNVSISRDSLYVRSESGFIGNIDVRVEARDGLLSVADTFHVRVGEYTGVQLSLGALASPVLDIVRFGIGHDSSLVSVNLTVQSQNIPLTKSGQIYFGNYEITSPGSLAVNASATDLHGFGAVVERSYTVSLLSKSVSYDTYTVEGHSGGYVLMAKAAVPPAPRNWVALGEPVELAVTNSAAAFNVTAVYRISSPGQPFLSDEAKVGFYSYLNGQWTYLAGSGRDGRIHVTLDKGGILGLFYDPDRVVIPTDFFLEQNFPNPFNPSTTIRYEVPNRTPVSIRVYNLLGQQIRTLYEGIKDAGRYEVRWDGRDMSGKPVASGLYLYRLEAGSFVRTKKMLLIK